MVQTESGKLYTGISTDVARRFGEHVAGSAKGGAKFFHSDPPRKVVYQQACLNRSEASKQEAKIKKMRRQQKLTLIEVQPQSATNTKA
jgi:putative endonuclease